MVTRAGSLLFILTAAASTFALDSGMVVILNDAGAAGFSRMTLHYLSTGDSLVLEPAGVRQSAAFSPDGRKIAYFRGIIDAWDQVRSELYTINVDGSNRQFLVGNIGKTYAGIRWATDGYIYWHGWDKVERIPEDGGTKTTVHTMVGGVPTGDGTGSVDPSNSSWQFSGDGTRSIGTAQRYTSSGSKAGWAQLAIDLTTGREFSPIAPCQGGISPDGNMISVSEQGHRVYRFAPWDIQYIEYFEDTVKVGDTYDGCRSGAFKATSICPDYDTVVWVGPDLNDMFSIGPTWADNPEIGRPRFSSWSNNVYMFNTSTPVNEQSGGSWLYDLATHEYTKVGPIYSDVHDYYAAEVNLARGVGLYPSAAYLSVDSAGTLCAPVSVALYSPSAMSGAPAISGTPAWLTVTPSLVSANEYALECALVAASVPAPGYYQDTVQVYPAGIDDTLELSVVLSVAEATTTPVIVIHSPTGGEVFAVGDTIRVEFSSDTVECPGTLLSLSVDGGESWWLMTTTDSYESGQHITFDYVIPPTLQGGGGTPLSAISESCIVRVSRYPNGYETLSGTFAIRESTASKAPVSELDRVSELSAMGRSRGNGIQLIVASPFAGTARLLDLSGRQSQSFALVQGRQLLTLQSVQPGRFVLDVRYDDGHRSYVFVEAR